MSRIHSLELILWAAGWAALHLCMRTAESLRLRSTFSRATGSLGRGCFFGMVRGDLLWILAAATEIRLTSLSKRLLCCCQNELPSDENTHDEHDTEHLHEKLH